VTLVGFSRGKSLNVYVGEERVAPSLATAASV
jgi:formate dehydrogenase assembly factor FdhD